MEKYIKLFRPSTDGKNKCCVQIYADHYACTLEHILALSRELRKDFSLEDTDIEIHKYGGERVKRITFVEAFLPASTKMPAGYREINEIEYIL